jgi:hypothetical protein
VYKTLVDLTGDGACHINRKRRKIGIFIQPAQVERQKTTDLRHNEFGVEFLTGSAASGNHRHSP